MLFGRNLDRHKADIALYQRIATDRFNAKLAQTHINAISTPDDSAAVLAKEWKATVGVRKEFDGMPPHITEDAMDLYQEVREAHVPMVKRSMLIQQRQAQNSKTIKRKSTGAVVKKK